jgi:hypothetical protein
MSAQHVGLFDKTGALKAELADQLRGALRRAGKEIPNDKFGELVDKIWEGVRRTVLGHGWDRERVRRWTRIVTDLIANPVTEARLDDWYEKSLAVAKSRYGSMLAAKAAIARANKFMREKPDLAGLREFLRSAKLVGLASHPQIVSDVLDDLKKWEAEYERKGRPKGFHRSPEQIPDNGSGDDDGPPLAA